MRRDVLKNEYYKKGELLPNNALQETEAVYIFPAQGAWMAEFDDHGNALLYLEGFAGPKELRGYVEAVFSDAGRKVQIIDV